MKETTQDIRFGGIKRLYGHQQFDWLQQAHFCVIGIGGVGSWAAEALARTGVGQLTLIDLDDICATNVNRQIHALTGTVGEAKVEAMKTRCELINPDIKINVIDDFITLDNIREHIQGFDYVIDCIDAVKEKAALIAHCKRIKLPVITTGGAGGQTDPSQISFGDVAKTTHDPLLAKVRYILRKQYNFSSNPKRKFNVDCVYSTEQLVYPTSEGEVCQAKQGADGFNKVGTETEKAGKKAKTSQSFWKSLKDEFFSLKGIMAGLGIGLLTSQIIGVGNVTEGWNASMYAITGSQAAATAELQHARGVAEQLGLDIKSTTNSYIQFTAATQGTELQGKNSKKVFDAITMSMRVLNKSADDTSGALKALEQMVSKGTVSSEELKQQLGERLPGAFGAAAKAMGVTTQELNKMLEQGQVLAADLLPKLADVLTQKYGPGLETALNSPAQAFRNLTNASFEFYEGLSNSLFDELATAAQALADAIQAVVPHLPAIISGLVSLTKISVSIFDSG